MALMRMDIVVNLEDIVQKLMEMMIEEYLKIINKG